jgi:hypothetical protein
VTAGPFTAQHVTVMAEGGTSYNGALVNRTTDATFVHLTAWATGSDSTTAISTDGGHLRHVRAYAKGGRVVYALFSGGSHGEIVDAVAEARATGFAGAIRNEAGAPTLRNVRAYAEGPIADGIVNGAATGARIYGAVIQARGGADFAHGIRNESADVVISGADIEVTADTVAYGVLTFLGGRCALVDVRIGVDAGGGGRGVFSDDGVVTTIDRSSVRGDQWSVAHGFGPAATRSNVGGSRLEGPVDAATGTITCVFSYDGALLPLDRSCRPIP